MQLPFPIADEPDVHTTERGRLLFAGETDFVKGDLTELPLSVIDALEAGISALAMDVAMREERVVDLASTWQAFDAALQGERTVA